MEEKRIERNDLLILYSFYKFFWILFVLILICSLCFANTLIFAEGKKDFLFYSYFILQGGIYLYFFSFGMSLVAYSSSIEIFYEYMKVISQIWMSCGFMNFILTLCRFDILKKRVNSVNIFVIACFTFVWVLFKKYYIFKVDRNLIKYGNMYNVLSIYIIFVFFIVFFMLVYSCYIKRFYISRLFLKSIYRFLLISLIPGYFIAVSCLKITDFIWSFIPIVYAFISFAFFFTAYRYRVFDILPYALKQTFSKLDSLIVICDIKNRVVFFNKESLFSTIPIKLFNNISLIDEYFTFYTGEKISDIIFNILNENETNVVYEGVYRNINKRKDVKVVFKSIKEEKDISAVLLIVHDITEKIEFYKSLEDKKKELLILNQYLNNFTEVAQELASEKENSKISNEIDVILKNVLLELKENIQIISNNIDDEKSDKIKLHEDLNLLISIGRNTLSTIRQSVKNFKNN